jgi:hypothetical protein
MDADRDWDDRIDRAAPPSGTGCAECDASGAWWFHLRRCAACGHVGCCDSSLNKHATAHARATGHRYMQSFEPGESWYWDYREEVELDGPELAPATAHPEAQTVPGPADRVPGDWMAELQARQQG